MAKDFICKECGRPFVVIYLCKYEDGGGLIKLCYNCSKKELSLNPHKVLKVLKLNENPNKLKIPGNLTNMDLGGLNQLDNEIKLLEKGNKTKHDK